MTTCTVEQAELAKERLKLWASVALAIVMTIVCTVLFFKLRTAVSERDYAYARADAAEAKAAQEAMRAAALDVKLSAKQVQLQLANDQTAQIRTEMLAKEQAYAKARSEASAQRDLPRGPLPIEISFNRSAGGGSGVGVFTNVSTKDLSVVVNLATSTNSKQANFTLDIPGRGRREIGPREGWQFARGDNITVSGGGFETMRASVE
ncbi:MAG TPA: hypothetical protein VJQ49_00530 [Casimicrobiaceae bacterium]|nr:hypothetical protein [Casimicrobiaceae bacterium]